MSSKASLARNLLAALAAAAFAMPLTASAAEPLGEAVRIRHDDLRNRTWVVGVGGAYLLEAGAPARRFRLPGWVLLACAGDCQPDLMVEPGGTVLVSSNIQPDLWRVDPEASTAVRMPIAPEGDAMKDVGFTGLRHGEHGQIDVTGTLDGAAWQIDLAAGRAVKLHLRNARE